MKRTYQTRAFQRFVADKSADQNACYTKAIVLHRDAWRMVQDLMKALGVHSYSGLVFELVREKHNELADKGAVYLDDEKTSRVKIIGLDSLYIRIAQRNKARYLSKLNVSQKELYNAYFDYQDRALSAFNRAISDPANFDPRYLAKQEPEEPGLDPELFPPFRMLPFPDVSKFEQLPEHDKPGTINTPIDPESLSEISRDLSLYAPTQEQTDYLNGVVSVLKDEELDHVLEELAKKSREPGNPK